MRTGEMVSGELVVDNRNPAKFAVFYKYVFKMGNHTAQMYVEVYGAIVSTVFIDGGTVTFTLKGELLTYQDFPIK
jgi:hypothetical protein